MRHRFLSRLADRLILQPSRHPIDPEGRHREVISTPFGDVEAWITTNSKPIQTDDLLSSTESAKRDFADSIPIPDLIVLKFPGTAGRAERGGPHPFELVPNHLVESWTINPIGYGGSQGRASLSTIASTCEAAWATVARRHPQTPVFVVGNSLGSLSALYMAARKNVAGVYLRNPVPIQQLIRTRLRYNWWNFGMARMIAANVPCELDAIENGGRAAAPLLLVSSERDRVVPSRYQAQVYAAYAGPKTVFTLTGADHHEPVPEHQVEDYKRVVRLFLNQVFP